jgi:glycosyltransferase involved in cell wall biosynthesis
MSDTMRVGVFHPALNVCGGAEWVAVNIINAVKSDNNQVILLVNNKTSQHRIRTLFGTEVFFDSEIVFPLELFATTDLHNIYTDAIRALILKAKCDVLIDTYSNALLSGVDIAYIHFPLAGRIPQSASSGGSTRKLKNAYYLPYVLYERARALRGKQLVLGNSKYTVAAIKEKTHSTAELLYPPISTVFFAASPSTSRGNTVVSVARICPDKRLTMIPQIASLTDKRIQFIIIGIRESQEELERIVLLAKKYEVADRVKIVTDVSRANLLGILKRSKVLLHPTFGEHFGVAIVEAMASGCIPIVHNSGGPQEFVPDLFRFDEPSEAAQKIDKTILEWSPQLPMYFRRLAEPFSQETFLTEFLRMFNSYVNQKII